MLDYWKFDTKKYIQDYDTNKEALQSLRLQLEELTEIQGMNCEERVQAMPGTDGLENFVIRRVFIKAQIKDYENYFNTFDKAYNSLTEEEKLLIDTFYRKGYINPVGVLIDRLGYEKSSIYRMRNQALNKFGKIVSGIDQYNGNLKNI